MKHKLNIRIGFQLCFKLVFLGLLYSQENPNIVVFVADDAGMDFGCYGNSIVQTPNIDNLSKNGIQFNQAILTAPQCSPSRTSMLSGQFAHTIGTEDLHNPLDSVTKLIPHYLKKVGYTTGYMLKGHLGEYGENQFDWTDNGMGAVYKKGQWYEKANGYFEEFLAKSGENPFFLWVGFIDPHRPYQDKTNGAPQIHNYEDIVVPPYLLDDDATKKDIATYYDEITRMDSNIGDMVTILENKNKIDNTIIIFISDNGYPFPRGKGTLYDSGIKTPFIVQWNKHIKPGTRFEGLTSTIDIAPTVLDVAGIVKPKDMYGSSLKKILLHPNAEHKIREYAFSERNWHGWDDYIRSVRTNKYKLIFNAYTDKILGATDGYDSPSWASLQEARNNNSLNNKQKQIFYFPRPMIELYDIENDPFELSNLAKQPQKYGAIIKELYSELRNWQIETKDHDPSERRMNDLVDRVTGAYFGKREDKHYIED